MRTPASSLVTALHSEQFLNIWRKLPTAERQIMRETCRELKTTIDAFGPSESLDSAAEKALKDSTAKLPPKLSAALCKPDRKAICTLSKKAQDEAFSDYKKHPKQFVAPAEGTVIETILPIVQKLKLSSLKYFDATNLAHCIHIAALAEHNASLPADSRETFVQFITGLHPAVALPHTDDDVSAHTKYVTDFFKFWRAIPATQAKFRVNL